MKCTAAPAYGGCSNIKKIIIFILYQKTNLTIMAHTNSEYCKYADVVIEWKETQEQESVKVALFPPEEMNLEADGLTDEDIFFYFLNPNGLVANRLGLDGEDFKIVKVIKMY
jgi:hypothetical protein